ncbi:MAG: cyclic pyranopterin monophosphate synthase MoaC [Deltaproteobacteria bacterium]|nr:cyclic pyranopterin monophosphate synthase MoaC [Deltaproteobacteria bacterium]
MTKPSGLTHIDPSSGRAGMVDVGHKEITRRTATASAVISISPLLVQTLQAATLAKGDAFTVAKTAAILAAKQTGSLIPMCHPLPLDVVEVRFDLDETKSEVRVEATAKTTAKTGVEMEAMVAVSVAALTFYDMCKSVDKAMVIRRVHLVRKTGGKSGDFVFPGEGE